MKKQGCATTWAQIVSYFDRFYQRTSKLRRVSAPTKYPVCLLTKKKRKEKANQGKGAFVLIERKDKTIDFSVENTN